MFESVAKNQHYVWRHYLEAWAIDEKVVCRRHSDGNIFATNPKNIGSERYFYGVQEFSDDELAYLEAIANASRTEIAREVNRNFVTMFTATTHLRRLVEVAAKDDEAKREAEELLLQVERGLGESWHCAVEDKGLQYLTRLRAGDATFWTNEDEAADFCFFLGTQYMRTARMRSEVRSSVLPTGLDLQRLWPVESHIWATEAGAALYRHRPRTHATLAVNATATPFVTGDQPVINIRPQNDLKPIFYYPVTPSLALMLSIEDANCQVTTLSVGALEVQRLNHNIFRWSDDQIYGIDAGYLKSLAAIPKVLDS